MIRGLIRLMLVAMVLVAAAFFFIGYGRRAVRGGSGAHDVRAPQIDTTAAREAGAEIGEKAATVAARVSESMEEGGLTAKIKAKMVLDDLVKARTHQRDDRGHNGDVDRDGPFPARARAQPGACEGNRGGHQGGRSPDGPIEHPPCSEWRVPALYLSCGV